MIRSLQELYQYRSLLFALTVRELRARYRGSVLGFLWTFLNPMLLMLVYALLFGFIMPNTTPAYTYYMLVGLLPWICFSSCVAGGASTISDRRDLLTKVRFPAQVLPASVVLTNSINYLLSLPIMIGLGLIQLQHQSWHAILFPLVLLVQLVYTLGLVFIVSALNVAFRDLQHIVSNLLQLWFYATPIVYVLTAEREHKLGVWAPLYLYGNPMGVIVRSYQAIFYQHTLPDAGALAGVLVVSLLLLWVATQIFERHREEFAEMI